MTTLAAPTPSLRLLRLVLRGVLAALQVVADWCERLAAAEQARAEARQEAMWREAAAQLPAHVLGDIGAPDWLCVAAARHHDAMQARLQALRLEAGATGAGRG